MAWFAVGVCVCVCVCGVVWVSSWLADWFSCVAVVFSRRGFEECIASKDATAERLLQSVVHNSCLLKIVSQCVYVEIFFAMESS